MTVSLDELAGPADAEMFRFTVDWSRYYIDPLPTCTIAEATEDRWPSCSTVKKAADKDWSFLTVNRIAALEPQELTRIAALDHTQRLDSVRSHEKFAKNVAFGRGSIVHLWGEDLGRGQNCREITDGWLAANGYPTAARTEAERYKRAMIDFFQTYQPELVAAEYVTIHRTLNEKGYGATPDGLFRIDGGVYGIDWKTRGESSSHAAYPEEAAQIACGARAEYMIVRVDDHAERRLMPDIVGGYVVSIRPDGARLYPVDIDKAFTHWTNLHQWWVHKQDEKASIGRVLPKRSQPKEAACSNAIAPTPSLAPTPETTLSSSDETTSTPSAKPQTKTTSTPPSSNSSGTPASSDWRFEAKRRYDLLNDTQKADYTARKQTIDTGDRDAVMALLDAVDPIQTVNVEPVRPTIKGHYSEPVMTPPDEGAAVNQADVDALQQRFKKLPVIAQTWTGTLVAQGKRTHDFRLKDRPTVRRYEIYRGVLALAEWAFDSLADGIAERIDDVVRVIYDYTTGTTHATTPPGELLGELDLNQAKQFADLAVDFPKGRFVIIYDDDGTLRLIPAA